MPWISGGAELSRCAQSKLGDVVLCGWGNPTAEQSTNGPSAAVATRSAGNRPEGSGPGTPLQTERGNTTIADAVVTAVATHQPPAGVDAAAKADLAAPKGLQISNKPAADMAWRSTGHFCWTRAATRPPRPRGRGGGACGSRARRYCTWTFVAAGPLGPISAS